MGTTLQDFSAFASGGNAIVAWLGFRYRSVVDLLWVAGVAVWLLAYFGPLGYSLFRHGSSC